MGIFEKIELEPVEETPAATPRSSRRWSDETIVVEYPLWKRLVSLFFALCLLPMLIGLREEGFFALEVLAVFGMSACIWYLADCLLTCDITFTPEGIVKRGYLGQTTLPAGSLVMRSNEQHIRFYHATVKNYRESITVYRYYLAAGDVADLLGYADDVYHVDGGEKGAEQPGLAMLGFLKAVSAYKAMAAFFAIFTCIAVFTVGTQESFFGLAPAIPVFPVRLACIALVAAGFFVLRKWGGSGDSTRTMSVEARLKGEGYAAFAASVVACAIPFPGLVLFLLAGNLLDYYLFLLVGVLCFVEFYPRYSRWEGAVGGRSAEGAAAEGVALPRRRSVQVSLVLMGALAVASYGETTNYLYKSRKDCLDDWGDDSACREVSSGSGRYYGPRYGSRIGRPIRAVGVGSISRGGFGSLGSFHASFGG